MNTLSIFIFFWNKTHLNLPNKYLNIHLQHQVLTGYMIFLHDQATHNKSYLLFAAQHDPATKMIGLGLWTSWPNKPHIRSLLLLASRCSCFSILRRPCPLPLHLPLISRCSCSSGTCPVAPAAAPHAHPVALAAAPVPIPCARLAAPPPAPAVPASPPARPDDIDRRCQRKEKRQALG
jgi:hypothetical protein